MLEVFYPSAVDILRRHASPVKSGLPAYRCICVEIAGRAAVASANGFAAEAQVTLPVAGNGSIPWDISI